MKFRSEFPRKVVEYPDMGIVMKDGTRLSARVWMPEDASENPVPVILEHLPYRKRDGTIARDQFTHPWFAGHGYACIRTDMRGNGESEGLMADEYTQQELDDAAAVIAWAAAQRWCNGKVGMMGISWGGFNGLQVAAMRPPALKAIITICSTVDRYADDIHYKGGCLLVENYGWASQMLAYSSRPPDPELVGDGWTKMWRHRLDNQPFHLSEWLRHQHRDAFWKHGSVCEDYSAIEAAVLSIGGWHDGYRNTISHLVENVKSPVKGIVGPWIHKYPHYAKPEPAIGFLQEALRWWDHWLKGKDTGVEGDPAYRAWLMDSVRPKRWLARRPGRWIAEREWPAPGIATETLHLAKGRLTSKPAGFSIAVSSPQDCGATGGEYFPFAFSDELPADQMPDDAKSACFDGAKLARDIDIVGAPEITLTLSSDKANGLVCVRLTDLRPDGTSALVTLGVFNLTHRQSHERPEPLVPGQPLTIRFCLDQIAYRVPKGHRLRLAVSNAFWPYVWPSPETGTLTLKSGSLALPLRPLATGDEWHFERPEAAPAWRVKRLREPSYSRKVHRDRKTGETITEVSCDNGSVRDLEHGLISGSRTTERWAIRPDDPNSATAEIWWEEKGGRKGAMWRTVAKSRMWSDATHFHFSASLKCWLNGKPFHAKDYRDSVRRQLV